MARRRHGASAGSARGRGRGRRGRWAPVVRRRMVSRRRRRGRNFRWQRGTWIPHEVSSPRQQEGRLLRIDRADAHPSRAPPRSARCGRGWAGAKRRCRARGGDGRRVRHATHATTRMLRLGFGGVEHRVDAEIPRLPRRPPVLAARRRRRMWRGGLHVRRAASPFGVPGGSLGGPGVVWPIISQLHRREHESVTFGWRPRCRTRRRRPLRHRVLVPQP